MWPYLLFFGIVLVAGLGSGAVYRAIGSIRNEGE